MRAMADVASVPLKPALAGSMRRLIVLAIRSRTAGTATIKVGLSANMSGSKPGRGTPLSLLMYGEEAVSERGCP